MTEQQISTASQAAMAGSRQSQMSIFSPFDGFQWLLEKRQPVGLTKQEGKDIAWLLTCSSAQGCTPEDAEGHARSLAYAVHLRREVPIAEALYRTLAGRGNDLVHAREVEEAMGCQWGEVDITVDGQQQRLDPYFWHMLETMIRGSVSEYVEHLEASMTMIRGCEPRQLTTAAQQAMLPVRRAVAHCLSQELLRRGSTTQSTVDMLQQMRNEVLPAHVEQTSQHLRQQVRRVRALARLVATPEAQLEEVLYEEEALVQELFAEMPRELEEQLANRCVSLLELGMLFVPVCNGLLATASSVPPASFAVRVAVLSRWMRRCSHAISEACVSTIATLSRVADLPLAAHEWSGVELCIATLSDPRTHGVTPEYMVHWKPPAHMGQVGQPRVVVGQRHCTHLNLRAARLFSLLIDQARLGLLPALTMKASMVLPIVARFTAEGEVNYGHYVDMQLRPFARKCEVPWPEDHWIHRGKRRKAPSPTPSDEPSSPLAPHGQPRRPPLLQPAVAAVAVQREVVSSVLPQQGNVPPKLLRDHAILHGLCLCLQPHKSATSVRMPLDEIVAMVRKVAPMLSSQSDSSLRQAVRWVTCEVIKQAHAQAATTDHSALNMEFSSDRDRTTDGRVGGLVCQGRGVAYLFQYASWCVNEMRFNGIAFCAVWKPSRSAQSKAGAMVQKLASGGVSGQ